MVIFKSKRKQLDGEIKLKLSHKRLFPTDSVKYWGVKIDGNLSWKSHIDYLSVKLSRSDALLFKIRNLATCHFQEKLLELLTSSQGIFIPVPYSSKTQF